MKIPAHAPGRPFVLIAAYNEAATIRALVKRTLAIVPDVIVVDDGSTDGTGIELTRLPVTLLSHRRNLGKAASLWRGFEHALAHGAGRVVTLDGDGQHDPDDIGRLLHAADRHPGCIVIGARLHDKRNFPAHRYYANQFARFWISWAAGEPIADTQSGFRVYPATLLAQLTRADVPWGRFAFESEILIVAGERGVSSVAIPIAGIYPPAARRSHFRPVVDIARIVAMVASRLVRRGMHPAGLWRSMSLPMGIDEEPGAVLAERIGEADGRSEAGQGSPAPPSPGITLGSGT